jgi:nicotinamide-nucleotide amidase
MNRTARRAEIISIGDEMTSGQRLDTNSQWLAQQLGGLGIEPAWHTTVADDLERQTETFRIAASRCQLVIATGGLGPTADDLTREVLARLSGQPLVRDDASLRHIEALFRRYGRPMPASNTVQADFPRGARIIPNAEGTAPGIDLDLALPGAAVKRCRIFCLPGVPHEMQAMWRDCVQPQLLADNPAPLQIVQRVVHCFGTGESQIESMLPGMIARDRQPRIGITASQAIISLRINAIGPDLAECQRLVERDETTIRESLGELVFGVEDQTLESVLVSELMARHRSLALVDLGLRGGVSATLSAHDPEGLVFMGGINFNGSPGTSNCTEWPELSLIAGTEPVQSAATLGLLSRRVAKLFAASEGVAIGPLCKTTNGKERFQVAWSGLGGEKNVELAHAGSSAIRFHRSVKQVLNWLRLGLNASQPQSSSTG